VTAIVLCGGRSTRFGSDKGLAVWRGRRLVDHVLAGLPDERAGTILVLRGDQDRGPWPAAPVARDAAGDPEGPLRGVIGGLEACPTEWAWVVACDQPRVQAALLRALCAAAAPATGIIVPVWQGRLQPLTGLYRAAAAPRLKQAREAGRRSLIGALETVGFRRFPEERCRLSDPRGLGFLNVNRPTDLEQPEGHEP
jgi:molybdopterin-guanine dinucleotide biosynthesis protein A